MKRNHRTSFKAHLKVCEQDFFAWEARHHLRLLNMSIQAEQEWIRHLHQRGIDTSGYPSEDVYLPELGITTHRVYFPDALKSQFRTWLHQEYFPGLDRLSNE
ncbi:MAG TPA: hypothetical protein VEL31_03055 [Ktedonobacteraceae bacterium]|nr:hypothetical protein [Ktedonobacteraceae bacterium]